MNEYNKELENFFEGNGKKSFENKQKEVDSKKKQIICPICGKVLKPNKYDAPITIKTCHFPLNITRSVYYYRDCKVSVDPVYSLAV
jgi:uncharacterized CHY-type Zn-finger protein